MAADLERRLERAHHVGQHGPHALALLDDRVEVLVPALERLRAGAREHLGVAHEPLERPGQLRGGRLVPGDQQRDQVVAQLALGGLRAVLAAGVEQQREHVVAALARSRRRRISAKSISSTSARAASKRRCGLPGPQSRCSSGISMIRMPVCGEPPERPLELGHPRAVDAEDRAQDDPQRQPLHGRQQRERLADRPGRHLGLGQLAHDVAVDAHRARRGTAAAAACACAGAGARRARAPSAGRRPARAPGCPRPACSCAGSPVKICLDVAGSLITTSGSNGHTFSANMSP